MYCKFCGQSLPTEGNFCPFCGKKICDVKFPIPSNGEDEPTMPINNPLKTDIFDGKDCTAGATDVIPVKKCVRCGQILTAADLTCPFCGLLVEPTKVSSIAPMSKENWASPAVLPVKRVLTPREKVMQKTSWALGIVAAVLTTVALALILYYLFAYFLSATTNGAAAAYRLFTTLAYVCYGVSLVLSIAAIILGGLGKFKSVALGITACLSALLLLIFTLITFASGYPVWGAISF